MVFWRPAGTPGCPLGLSRSRLFRIHTNALVVRAVPAADAQRKCLALRPLVTGEPPRFWVRLVIRDHGPFRLAEPLSAIVRPGSAPAQPPRSQPSSDPHHSVQRASIHKGSQTGRACSIAAFRFVREESRIGGAPEESAQSLHCARDRERAERSPHAAGPARPQTVLQPNCQRSTNSLPIIILPWFEPHNGFRPGRGTSGLHDRINPNDQTSRRNPESRPSSNRWSSPY
jgi:hypothetical protein